LTTPSQMDGIQLSFLSLTDNLGAVHPFKIRCTDILLMPIWEAIL